MLWQLQVSLRNHSAVPIAQKAFTQGDLSTAHKALERFEDKQSTSSKVCTRRGAAQALRAQLNADLERVAAPYKNKFTLQFLDPIGTVPQKRLLVTHDAYAFDVKELGRFVRTSSRFVNPCTGEVLSTDDNRKLLQHPQASELRRWWGRCNTKARFISQATRAQLTILAATLVGDRQQNTIASIQRVAEALATFRAYMDTLSLGEREALRTYPATYGSFGGVWKAVAEGRRCTAQFSAAISNMLRSMAKPR